MSEILGKSFILSLISGLRRNRRDEKDNIRRKGSYAEICHRSMEQGTAVHFIFELLFLISVNFFFLISNTGIARNFLDHDGAQEKVSGN
jgi:hypothetical protein